MAQGAHRPGGGVQLDYGADGSVDESYPSCEDPSLAQCG
jgi:hypothetical protein